MLGMDPFKTKGTNLTERFEERSFSTVLESLLLANAIAILMMMRSESISIDV